MPFHGPGIVPHSTLRLCFFSWYILSTDDVVQRLKNGSSDAKLGKSSVLAVATEQGSIEVIDTRKRSEDDPGTVNQSDYRTDRYKVTGHRTIPNDTSNPQQRDF